MYTPGKDNIIADMLSRYPIHSVTSDEIKQMCTVLEVNSVEEQDNDSCPIDFRVIAKHQANDATLQTLLQTDDYSQLRLDNLDIIFYQQDKIAIPASLLDLIIKWYHTLLNHPDIDRTYRTISAHFYCKGMEVRARELIRQCSCQKNKRTPRQYGTLPPNIQHYEPWECVQVDRREWNRTPNKRLLM